MSQSLKQAIEQIVGLSLDAAAEIERERILALIREMRSRARTVEAGEVLAQVHDAIRATVPGPSDSELDGSTDGTP